MQKASKIILGIDPGTLVMGYSIIEICGQIIAIREMNVLKLSGRKDNYQRLQLIHQKVVALVQEHLPDELAIEAPFFGKNVQSMLKLGRAQGVAIAAAMSASIPVTEYSPKKVKQAITGNGNADKEQIWKMLQRMMQLAAKPKYFDASDALAVAVCHHFQTRTTAITRKEKLNGWNDFIKKNPARVR